MQRKLVLFSLPVRWMIGDEPDERRKEVPGQGEPWVGKERGPSFFLTVGFQPELVNTGCW